MFLGLCVLGFPRGAMRLRISRLPGWMDRWTGQDLLVIGPWGFIFAS